MSRAGYWHTVVGKDDAVVERRANGSIVARAYMDFLSPFRRLSDLDEALQGDCLRGYETLAVELGFLPRVWVIAEADVFSERDRGKGMGVELYAQAATIAADHAAVIIPMACVGGYGTSLAAKRVWASDRFAAAVALAGPVAYGGAVMPGRRKMIR